jgi:hypothetical protein
MASSHITTLPNELLELILLKLSMEDLLRSMRVCRIWHNYIRDSSQLQISLFMEPLEKSKEAPDSQPNPLLLKIFPALFESTKGSGMTVEQIINKLPWSKNEQWSKAIAHPTASWRKMYTEQPPKHHILELGDGCARLTSSSIPTTMVLNLFWLDGDTTYDTLCMEDHPKKRIYRLDEPILGEKLESRQEFERVLRASSD